MGRQTEKDSFGQWQAFAQWWLTVTGMPNRQTDRFVAVCIVWLHAPTSPTLSPISYQRRQYTTLSFSHCLPSDPYHHSGWMLWDLFPSLPSPQTYLPPLPGQAYALRRACRPHSHYYYQQPPTAHDILTGQCGQEGHCLGMVVVAGFLGEEGGRRENRQANIWTGAGLSCVCTLPACCTPFACCTHPVLHSLLLSAFMPPKHGSMHVCDGHLVSLSLSL